MTFAPMVDPPRFVVVFDGTNEDRRRATIMVAWLVENNFNFQFAGSPDTWGSLNVDVPADLNQHRSTMLGNMLLGK